MPVSSIQRSYYLATLGAYFLFGSSLEEQNYYFLEGLSQQIIKWMGLNVVSASSSYYYYYRTVELRVIVVVVVAD
jgi:hypothetical protein